ncbi:COP23 domain-containing protein [Fischerella sp. PCC 9605]|uniref:COP23 domain-containing protein n=1 Tax=Fischerella sp. PCC 9605 TaxID=1173024 RepID=UPI0004799A24|nr:COP23 domain-containing protein [Fischerella sp. PCC 9605]
MSSRTLKFLLLSSLGLSLFVGNSAVLAQNRSGDVVVPTVPDNGTSSTTRSTTRTSTTTNGRTTSTNNSSTTVTSATRFVCENYDGQYTVMYQPESQPGRYFPWATPKRLGGGWDEYKRCATIAQRLETYRPDGLIELRTATENGYNTLCVTSEANPSCRIVLTVPPGYDPYNVRNSVFQNLIAADSGEQTIGVNTYTSSNNGSGIEQIYNMGRTILGGSNSNNRTTSTSKNPINLKPFLDAKDGGTGSELKKGVAISPKSQPQSKPESATRLNPNKFR